MTDSFSIYLPFSKIEDNKDGSITVWGRATQEVVDSEKEICDYETSAPLFRRRSQMMMDASEGGNLFPLRVMHLPIAAGKIVQMDFVDAERAIDVVAKVIDQNEIKKVRERVYTGFSVGGNYARRWRDSSGAMRFTGDPREISLVDVPSVPTARFTMFKLEDYGDGIPGLIEAVEYIKRMGEDNKGKEDHLVKMGELVGIERRSSSPLIPAEYLPQSNEEYGDPANWMYPADINNFRKSVDLFNRKVDEENYSPRGRHILGRRIARLAGRFEKSMKYDPSAKKIVRKETSMNDLNNLKEIRDQLAAMAEGDSFSKDGITALVGQLDALVGVGTPVGSNISGPALGTGTAISGVPSPSVPSTPLQKSEPPVPSKKEDPSEPSASDPSGPPAQKVESPAPPKKEDSSSEERMSKMENAISQMNDQFAALNATLEKALTKAAPKPQPQSPQGPLGDLNALVERPAGDPIAGDPIVAALLDGGPYAMVKALKLAGIDDEGIGSQAFAKVNDAIRKATYASLEAGGVVTASRFRGRIYDPA